MSVLTWLVTFSRRVVRGNTYSSQILPQTAVSEGGGSPKSRDPSSIRPPQLSGLRQRSKGGDSRDRRKGSRKGSGGGMSETMNSSVAPQEQEECLLEELDAPVDIEVETPQEQFVTDRPPSPVASRAPCFSRVQGRGSQHSLG
eukprot:3135470-Rhodomonas_salina.2